MPIALQEIESQLQDLLEKEKRQWTTTAKLLIEIDRGQLFKNKAKSFSQYIRILAKQFKIHESTFWRIKKAGEYYLKLNATDDIQVIDKAKTTPEQVEILRKISTVAPPEIVENIEKKMINGETTRQELRDIWETYRPIKEGKNERGRKPKNIEKEKVDQPHKTASSNQQSTSNLKKENLTTANILSTLQQNQGLWIKESIDIENNIEHFHLFKEVAVKTGTTRHARRIDAVVLIKESYKKSTLTTIGIEIKSNLNDLKNDKKMSEYIPFCHFFYLAIPNEQNFIETAKNLITPQIGILCITEEIINGYYQVVIIKKAQKNQSQFVGELYEKCLCHTLNWLN